MEIPGLSRLSPGSLSIGSKLVLIYVFGIFAPLLLANGLVLRSVSRDTILQERIFLQASVENIAANVTREFEPVLIAAEFVYADRLIYRLLATEFDSFQHFVELHRDQLMPALAKYVSVFPSVKRMLIYTENPIPRVSEGYLSLNRHTRAAHWYARLGESRPGIIALVHTDTDPRLVIEEQSVLSVFRELDNPVSAGGSRLVLRVDVNLPLIQRGLASSEIVGAVEVVDSAGTTVVSRSSGAPEASVYRFDRPLAPIAALSGWRIRGAIAPAAPIAPWSVRWTRLLVVSGLSLAASSLFILVLSRSVTSRLRSLSRHMRKVEREDFSPLNLGTQTNDELGHLIEDFNLMARKIDALINSGYKLEIERQQLLLARRQAELGALQSQVNPHFLYNVLESIRMRSHIKGEQETAAVVKKLSRAFRRITSWESDLVTLGEEIAFTREYLEIQQYRFGTKLQVYIDIDADAAACLIPKMTIQGLVENACIHGIEQKPGSGRVVVTANRDRDAVQVRVQDDGIGCNTTSALEAHREEHGRNGHVGLSNIRRRLAYHYGSDFNFAFESSPGEGTTVTITIAPGRATAKDPAVEDA